MAILDYVELRFPEAHRLADLVGISSDLDRVTEYASYVLDKFKDGNRPPSDILGPFSIAVAITYSRPFITGVRARLGDDDLKILDEQELAAHNHLRAYRDKHFAHSVNCYEENVARAHYRAGRERHEGFLSISYQSARVEGMSRSNLGNALHLSQKFAQHVHQLMGEEQKRLLEVVRSKSIEEVLAGGKKVFNADGPIDKARKR